MSQPKESGAERRISGIIESTLKESAIRPISAPATESRTETAPVATEQVDVTIDDAEDILLEERITEAMGQEDAETRKGVGLGVLDEMVETTLRRDADMYEHHVVKLGQKKAADDGADFYSIGLKYVQDRIVEQLRATVDAQLNAKQDPKVVRQMLQKSIDRMISNFLVGLKEREKDAKPAPINGRVIAMPQRPEAPVSAPQPAERTAQILNFSERDLRELNATKPKVVPQKPAPSVTDRIKRWFFKDDKRKSA